jgi:hypothetical protein
MADCNAVRTGFSIAFRRPTLFAAELAWRWAFDTAAWLLILYGIALFLRSVPVSDADMFGLSGIIPGRVGATILHILAGSGPKMVRVAFVLLLGLNMLSWMANSLGRASVLRAMLNSEASPLASLGVNFLRTSGSLLVTLAYAGCIYLIARAGQTEDAAQGHGLTTDFSLGFAALAFLISWVWRKLDGRLSLANIFILRSDEGMAGAIVSATEVSLRRVRQFAWIGFVFGAIKAVLWAGAFFGVMMAFSIFAPFSAGLGWCGVLAVLMTYSALTNFLGVGALAAQMRVIEWDEQTS